MSTLRTDFLQNLDETFIIGLPQLIGNSARYLPPSSSDPVSRENGDPLQTGDEYYNTSTQLLKTYDGASWVAIPTQNSVGVVVTNYGTFDTPTNTTSAIMAAWTAATLQGRELWFPAGTYTWNGANLAANNLTIRSLGQVILQNNAAGVALTISGGATNLYNFKMLGTFKVRGNATSTNGVLIRRLHHAQLELDVKNVPGIAFDIQYGVCFKYYLTCSANTDGGFTITPTTGLKVDVANAGEFVSASEFFVIIEGVSGVGVDIINMQQCKMSGTSEHNGGVNIRTAVGSKYNTFTDLDLEQGLAGDADLSGVEDTWINLTCRSVTRTNNIELIAAIQNHFIGGDLRSVNEQTGCSHNIFENCRFSDNAALGLKFLAGSGSTRFNCPRYNVSGVITQWYTNTLGPVGTFTPAIAGATTAGTNTYSTQIGYYEVIGNRVFVDISIVMTAKDAAMSGSLLITGLPFLSNTTAGRTTSGPVGRWGNITQPTAGYTGLGWQLQPNSTSLLMQAYGYGQAVLTTAINVINANSEIHLSFSYPINSQVAA